jgi:tetratricopeptide (TPR) repeat protein
MHPGTNMPRIIATGHSAKIRRWVFAATIFAVMAAISCPSILARPEPQQQQGQQPAPPTDPSQESSSKKDPLPDTPGDSSSKKPLVPVPPDDQPKSKGAKPGVLPPEDDLDAAIARFEDAVRLRANFAKPRLLLAETYEKKGDKSEALRYYKEYLQILPNPPDAKKIHEKVDKLSKK